MNAYDFDGTVYAGDSSADFYRWCLRRYPALVRYAPRQALAALRYYAAKKGSKTEMKQVFFSFLRSVPVTDYLLKEFWDEHENKLCAWYLRAKREDDVIISASPEFLLRPLMRRLGLQQLLASRVEPDSGRFEGLNCHGEEKVLRFRARFPEAKIECFYSDRLSDTPMARQADSAVLVKNRDAQHADFTLWPKG